jgi:MFS family permease
MTHPQGADPREGHVKDFARIARKITIVLFLSQSLSSAGFVAAFTVNAIVGVDLSGRPAMAGVPGAVYVLGKAFSALVWGFSVERIGRRGCLALGQVIGVIGSAIAMGSVVNRSLMFFLAGLVLMGIARSAVDLARFAAAEVHMPAKRGRAISYVVMGSTVGGVLGPLVVGPAGKLAQWAGYAELAGPYSVVFVGLILAAILIYTGLRPEPSDVGREIARLYPESVPQQGTRPLAEIVRQPGVIVAIVSVAFAEMVMIMPMSITSVHMKTNGHSLNAVSLVISLHCLGMYAFSAISGQLTDRWGRGQVIILGSVMMIVSCLMAAPSTGFISLLAALFLLGVGWNFAYVAGSTLLADQLSPGERAKTQGFNDLLLSLTSATSQAVSGVMYGVGGYGVMALAAAAAAIAPLALAVWWKAAARKMTATREP